MFSVHNHYVNLNNFIVHYKKHFVGVFSINSSTSSTCKNSLVVCKEIDKLLFLKWQIEQIQLVIFVGLL